MCPENELCIRHRGPFDDLATDAALLAQLMGRDQAEGTRGTAICGGCLTAEEIRAIRDALARAQPDPPTDVFADELNDVVTFLGQRCSMGRVEVADLMNILLEKLANASERHHVPFEDMLVKLLWVARHEPRDWGES